MQRITRFGAAFLSIACLRAQEAPGEPASPLTVGQKFTFHLEQTMDPASLAAVGFGAGIDQALMIPRAWGGGMQGFGKRFGSAFAENAVEQQLRFAVEAMDGEDPRLPRAHGTGFWHRATSAALTTFYRNDGRGGHMIAWSEFVGAYGSAYISHQWWPRPFNNFANGFVAGTDSVGMDVGMDVLREFMPDMKRALFRQKKPAP